MKRIILLLLIFTGGCYSPNGGYYNADIQPKDAPKLGISLNNYDNASTISIFEPTTFSYNLTASSGQIINVQILFNGQPLGNNSPAAGSFSIPPNLLKSGTYELKIVFDDKAGDGSLADKLGVGTAEVWRTWTLVIDVDRPPTPVPAISTENGYLKISWTPYTRSNFTKYTVTIYLDYSIYPDPVGVITITEPTQSFYLDKTYVGNYRIRYYVSTSTHIQSHTAVGTVARADEMVISGNYRESDSTVLLTWSKADFASAFKSYTIIETGVDRMDVTNVSDTVLRIKPKDVLFGLPFNYTIRTNPATGYQPLSGGFVVARPITTSNLSPFPGFVIYNNTYQKLFSFSSPNLISYDLNFHVQTTTNVTGFNCMPYESANVYYNDANGIYQKNMQTNDVQHLNVLNMTTGGILQGVAVQSASSNQIVIFNYRAHDASASFLVNQSTVYDMANHVKLSHLEDTNGGDITFNLSASGQYLVVQKKRMYHINGSALEYLYDLPAAIPFFGFYGIRIDNVDEWIWNTGTSINIYDNATGVLKRSIPFPGSNFLLSGYDVYSKNFFFTAEKSKVCYAVHADTKAVKTIHAYTVNAFDYRLIGGNVIDANGYYFKAIPD